MIDTLFIILISIFGFILTLATIDYAKEKLSGSNDKTKPSQKLTEFERNLVEGYRDEMCETADGPILENMTDREVIKMFLKTLPKGHVMELEAEIDRAQTLEKIEKEMDQCSPGSFKLKKLKDRMDKCKEEYIIRKEAARKQKRIDKHNKKPILP